MDAIRVNIGRKETPIKKLSWYIRDRMTRIVQLKMKTEEKIRSGNNTKQPGAGSGR
jgi:hypothetical protein